MSIYIKTPPQSHFGNKDLVTWLLQEGRNKLSLNGSSI